MIRNFRRNLCSKVNGKINSDKFPLTFKMLSTAEFRSIHLVTAIVDISVRRFIGRLR